MAEPSPPSVVSKRLDEHSLDFRSKTVEEALAPLIEKVTTLTDYKSSRRRTGKPRKVTKLVQIVDKATRNFITVGEEIANENPEFQEELLLACDEVRAAGEEMHKASSEFSQDTMKGEHRGAMVKAARKLLLSVTRLMVVADAIDVSKLLKISGRIETKLRGLCDAKDEEDLMDRIKDCAPDISNITQLATLRQNDLKSEASQQLLAAAQMQLNQTSKMLISSSKAFLQHPDSKTAEENRDYVITRMLEALKTISLLADGEDPDIIEFGAGPAVPGDLAASFTELEAALDQSAVVMATSDSASHQASLQQGLENILWAAAQLAASESTRDHRQHTIISHSGELKEKLQGLLGAFAGEGEGEGGEGVERSKVVSECVMDLGGKMAELRKELRRAQMDHVSDAFVDSVTPLVLLCEAAQNGDTQLVEQRATTFSNHAHQMEKVALLACSLSEDTEGNRMVKVTAKHCRILRPQVVNAARTLAAHPDSHIAQKNMAIFKETWSENVQLLTDCIDAILPLQDFMAVTEAHVREDSQRFLQVMESCDTQALQHTTHLIEGRCNRLAHVVRSDLGDNPDHYSPEQAQQIDMAIQKLMEKSFPWFRDLASKAVETLHSTHDPKSINTQALEEAIQKVNDDVRNVRRGVLMTRTQSELEGESDLEDLLRPPRPITPAPSLLSQVSSSSTTITSPRRFVRTPRHSMIFDEKDTTRAVMAQLPAEQQAKLAKVAEGLSTEKAKLETEVSKWDDRQNDIILLAKEMCMMVMDMSDFTRGLGPLRTTMDVIVTAKDIARAGEYMDELARTVADQCPDEQCKKDLLAYLDRIRLYCHQLKITSAVKADLDTSIMETVDSASALITAAKNLMNVVVLIVTTSYVASTAIARMGGSVPEQVFQWRLAAPKKKRLYPSESQGDLSGGRSHFSPIRQLGEFKPGKDVRAAGESIMDHGKKKETS